MRFDVMFANGKYEKDGVEKTRWVKVGSIFTPQSTGKPCLKLDCIPAGEWNGFLSLFDKENDSNFTGNVGEDAPF